MARSGTKVIHRHRDILSANRCECDADRKYGGEYGPHHCSISLEFQCMWLFNYMFRRLRGKLGPSFVRHDSHCPIPRSLNSSGLRWIAPLTTGLCMRHPGSQTGTPKHECHEPDNHYRTWHLIRTTISWRRSGSIFTGFAILTICSQQSISTERCKSAPWSGEIFIARQGTCGGGYQVA
jgi:hypothetical protein